METGLNLRGFLDLCEDSGFRRIVLVDGPNILGRTRWTNSSVWMRRNSCRVNLQAAMKVICWRE